MQEKIQKILQEEINAIKAIPTKGIEEAAKLIAACQGKLVFTGMGKAGLIGKKIAATFASTGTSSFFMHPAEAQHGDLGMIQAGDLIISLSNSGKTREVIETVLLAKTLVPGIKLITITANSNAELARVSDVVIETGGYPEVCPLGMAPTCSTTAMLVIGDVLAMLVMDIRGFTLECWLKRHHSGYLGQKAKEQLGFKHDDE